MYSRYSGIGECPCMWSGGWRKRNLGRGKGSLNRSKGQMAGQQSQKWINSHILWIYFRSARDRFMARYLVKIHEAAWWHKKKKMCYTILFNTSKDIYNYPNCPSSVLVFTDINIPKLLIRRRFTNLYTCCFREWITRRTLIPENSKQYGLMNAEDACRFFPQNWNNSVIRLKSHWSIHDVQTFFMALDTIYGSSLSTKIWRVYRSQLITENDIFILNNSNRFDRWQRLSSKENMNTKWFYE